MSDYFSDEKMPQSGQMLGSMEVRNRDIIPRLKAQRQEMMARVAKIDKLLSLLERNPEVAQVIDLARELT